MYPPLNIPVNGSQPFTDYSRWRLKINDGGRQVWYYLSEDQSKLWPQSDVDKYWTGVSVDPPILDMAQDPLSAARNGYKFYKRLQSDDGHWAGEYGGPMFLLPGLVIGSYITGMEFEDAQRLEMVRYVMNHANEDGGWGIHIEGHSTVFGTALNYVAMRLLGVDAEHPVLVKARSRLHELGGATGVPAWGKWWLSVLNVYEWAGNNPYPPELFLLPEAAPIHPHRFWIHMRNILAPVSFVYGKRWKASKDPLIMSLRQEIHVEPYNKIDWAACRNKVHAADLYTAHSQFYDFASIILHGWEHYFIPEFRNKALDIAYDLVIKEDENTAYQTIGPVSKMMNLICRYIVDGRNSESWEMHKLKRLDFMWLGRDGMMMSGTNGTQLWDLAFIAQALVESGLAEEDENRESVTKALDWLDKAQMQENPRHYESAYRHASKGAWAFSTREQGYTVSDSTAEGLKAVLLVQEHLSYTTKVISERRLCDAVDIMLSLQNPNGGVAGYELVRAPKAIEYLNPAEVFEDVMIEHTYTECTTSVVSALTIFKRSFPTYRADDIGQTIAKAIRYIHSTQLDEGGWYGSWGICFTYATMFALEALSLAGETYKNSPEVKNACEFLINKQRPDGGWGESYKSCETKKYVQHERSQVVQTSWAAMALMYARYPHREHLERAVRLVIQRQLPDGSWAQESIEGVFSKNVAISYPNFKFSFTIWMLGKAHKYLNEL